jgi:hypothetical protein
LLQASKVAREELLRPLYVGGKFIVTFDMATREFHRTNLTCALEVLSENLASALFAAPPTADFHSLTITFINFEGASLDVLLEWVELSLSGYMSPNKLLGPVTHTNWTFNMWPMPADIAVLTELSALMHDL